MAEPPVLWRLNGGLGLWYRAWPDTTLPNRLIKLAGAVLVLLRGAISLAMLGLGVWAIVAVVRLPRSG